MTIDDYQQALFREMYFLKNSGGRNYKVFDGAAMGVHHGMFVYSFELESELYLSDDAPIVLTVGYVKATGNVLVCEGFQIIVIVDQDFGSHISRALINVEPWKLLETLHDHLSKIMQPESRSLNRIAINLLYKGPELATNMPASCIPKGQDIAKEKGLEEEITVIWGPPGTGKTYTMAQIAIDALQKEKTVLIVSHSNISVDGALLEIADQLRNSGQEKYLKKGAVLRYGYVRDERLSRDEDTVSFNYALKNLPSLKSEMEDLLREKDKIRHSSVRSTGRQIELEEELKKLRLEVRRHEKRYIEKASIVATTISKAIVDPVFENRQYDYVLFDEASMAYVPQLICAASYARRHFIAVGDFRQLAPIAQSESRNILCKDIFSYLGICEGTGKIYYHPWLVMLDVQRRMYPDISAFVNRNVYGGLLRDYELVAAQREQIVKNNPLSGYAMNLIDLKGTYCAATKDENNSRYNVLSAVISVATAINSVKHGEKSVGIITPYSAQTRLIRAMLQDYYQQDKIKEISCATVHQFQGSERNVIILDAVESYPSSKPGWLMAKNDNGNVTRLINVAVTRARGKFIAVANSRFWMNKVNDSSNLFRQLIGYLMDKGNVVAHAGRSLENYIEQSDFGNCIIAALNLQNALDGYMRDLDLAKEKIVISIPDGSLDGISSIKIYKALMNKCKEGIAIYCKSNDCVSLPEIWHKITEDSKNAIFPLTVIDNKVIWYGMPSSQGVFHDGDWSYKTVCPVYLRITGQHTVDIIRSLTDLESKIDENGMKKPLVPVDDPDKKKTVANRHSLSMYIFQNEKCPKCGKPMKLTRGRSGKCYLKCSNCNDREYLTKYAVNEYIAEKHITCPIHHCPIHAGLSKYGIYVRCESGHYLKPDEI